MAATEQIDARSERLAAHCNDLGTSLASHAIDAAARSVRRHTLPAVEAKPKGRRA